MPLPPPRYAFYSVSVHIIAFIAVVSYVAARSVPVGRIRALGYAAGIVALTLVVLWIENLVDH